MWSISAKDFDFSKLCRFESLKYVWLHGHKGVFDFSILKDLPNIEELEISTFDDVLNMDQLRHVKTLKKVRMTFIKNKNYKENKGIIDHFDENNIEYEFK